ncbi:MAG: preprotein translocase subunit SecE [Planctomycetota bacterium]
MIVRIYHKEQAAASRLIAGATVLALGVFAYVEMAASQFLGGRSFPKALQVARFPDTWGQAVGGVCLLAFAAAGWFLLNRPRVVEFLVAVETELRKVSWPTRQQALGSAGVVIVTMLVLAAYLFLLDAGLTWLIRRVIGG